MRAVEGATVPASMPVRVPWRLRRRLRKLGKCARPVVNSSGVKEWSDGEVARLQTGWISGFLRRHVCRCAFLALLYLVALAFLGASVERYWHWIQTIEADAGEPIRKVDQWKAYCVVKPWARGCKPVPKAAVQDMPGIGRAAAALPWRASRVEAVAYAADAPDRQSDY
jgi:hypothetical protein